jgi:hypothetical protein
MSATKKDSTFGTCRYDRLKPPKEDITASTKSINVIVSFEEALKLNLAVQEGLRKLNRYKMSAKEGKQAAINLCLHTETKHIAIVEDKLQ